MFNYFIRCIDNPNIICKHKYINNLNSLVTNELIKFKIGLL